MNTPRPHPAAGPRPARRSAPPVRGLALALALLAPTSLAGCGASGARHGSEPVTRRETSRLTEGQRRMIEAREQSALAASEPYWPYRLGQLQLEADSLIAAEGALRSSLRRDPSYAPALALLSKLLYDARRHQDGVELLESARARAAAASTGMPPALLGALALHYEALGRHDLAGALVAGAKAADPGRARSALVYVTLRGDDPGAATDLARAAVDDDPKSAVNQNNFGITRLRSGDPRAAREAFARAIQLDPSLPGPYYNLSIVERYFFFDDDAAARWLKAYRERATDDPDGLFGMIEKDAGRPVAEEGGRP